MTPTRAAERISMAERCATTPRPDSLNDRAPRDSRCIRPGRDGTEAGPPGALSVSGSAGR